MAIGRSMTQQQLKGGAPNGEPKTKMNRAKPAQSVSHANTMGKGSGGVPTRNAMSHGDGCCAKAGGHIMGKGK